MLSPLRLISAVNGANDFYNQCDFHVSMCIWANCVTGQIHSYNSRQSTCPKFGVLISRMPKWQHATRLVFLISTPKGLVLIPTAHLPSCVNYADTGPVTDVASLLYCVFNPTSCSQGFFALIRHSFTPRLFFIKRFVQIVEAWYREIPTSLDIFFLQFKTCLHQSQVSARIFGAFCPKSEVQNKLQTPCAFLVGEFLAYLVNVPCPVPSLERLLVFPTDLNILSAFFWPN